MERTKYWNNTKPSETQLDNTENSKINHTLYRSRSGCQFGIKNGFLVTVNGGDNTKIDIGPGTGYTGGYFPANNYAGSPNSGERISTNSSTTAIGLADYAASALNYVSLVYAETASTPLPERFYPGTLRNTIYTATFTAEVLTAAQWGALTADDIEERILVGIVTANGAGVPLTPSSIQLTTQPKTHPTCPNPSSITGVTIDQLASITPVGTATLRFEKATNKLFWTAPGDAEGTGTTITSNGSFTLYSSTTTYYVVVAVVFGNLPAGNVTETLLITALYGRTIPLFSSIDQVHRDMVGTGVVTTQNPHGISIDDIGGGTTDHADLFHINGIGINATSTELGCSSLGTLVHITNLGGFENSFLIDGYIYETVLGFGAGTDATLEMSVAPANIAGDYLVYLDGTSTPHYILAANCVAGGADPMSPLTNIEIIDLANSTVGNCTLAWDDTTKKLIYTAAGDAAGAAVCIGNQSFGTPTTYGYYKLYSNNTDNWVIVSITGDLGVANTATFHTHMTSADHAHELILKLNMFNWDGAAVISNMRDIRQWLTSDIRDLFLEEHDSSGNHTIPLRNTLRIARTSLGLYSSVSGIVAIGGSADRTGVYGKVDDEYGVIGLATSFYGVWGQAENVGVFGMASASVGVGGVASETGVEGIASTYGVRGIATIGGPGIGSTGVYGYAEGDCGVYGSAGSIYGVYGIAPNSGVVGIAATARGVYGSAPNSGVVGIAATARGVYGSAANSGIMGIAATAQGVYGNAPNSGVVGIGDTAQGVYGSAPNIAIYGTAATAQAIYGSAVDTGIYGKVANQTGVLGSAGDVIGVYGEAQNFGVFGIGWVSYGIRGSAGDNYGVHGTALNKYGVYGEADTYGVWGSAINYGVSGTATNYGVCGSAKAETGVYGKAVTYGVFGTANTFGVYGTAINSAVCGIAAVKIGIYGSAEDTAGFFAALNNAKVGLEIGVGCIKYNIAEVDTVVASVGVIPIMLADGSYYQIVVNTIP